MALNINGTTGISGVDGSASAPALQGTDSNTGINFASDTVNINTGGATRVIIDSSGNLKAGTITDTSGNNSSTTAQIAEGRAKAWIRYKIDSSGVTNQDSFGIAGTADNGLGDVIITFSTAMANDDYCWSFVTGVGMWNGTESYATTTTLRLRNMARFDSYTNADSDINACVVFGDQ